MAVSTHQGGPFKMSDENISKKIHVWDIPVRLFHWSLVALFCFSFYSGKTGGFELMDYHMYSGYTVLTLIIFRILWGFFGGRYARFSHFIQSPGKIAKYLGSLKNATEKTTIGHNPAGGLSVVIMLLLLLGQGLTGLFTNDDIMLEGPLTHLVSYDQSRSLTGLHETISWLLVGVISLHIFAIIFYRVVRKVNLVKPMITGQVEVNIEDEVEHQAAEGTMVLFLRGVGLLALCSGFVYWVINI